MPRPVRRLLHGALHQLAYSRMPGGKPAGVPCVQLLADMRCAIFGSPERPAVCAGFLPEESVCGQSRADALRIIGWLESETGVGTAC